MGRSQVQYNKLHGRGRGNSSKGGRGGGGGRGSKGNHNLNSTKTKQSHLNRAGDNSWRFNNNNGSNPNYENLSSDNSTTRSNEYKDDNDVTTSYLLSQYDQALNTSYYKSVDYDDPSSNEMLSSEAATASLDYMTILQSSKSFAKSISSLKPSIRLRLPSDIGKRWDDITINGALGIKQTLAQLNIEQEEQEQISQKKESEYDVNMDKEIQASNEIQIEEAQDDNNIHSDQNNNDNEINNETIEENEEQIEEFGEQGKTEEEEEEQGESEEEEEEDLDAWLDSVIS